MKHKYADLMLDYAQDAQETETPWELWEHKHNRNSIWQHLTRHPVWDYDIEYRRKPRTIRIGNYDVPEPLRVAPNRGVIYFFPSFISGNKINGNGYTFSNDATDRAILKRGMMHLTKEAAELHAKALISLTEQQ